MNNGTSEGRIPANVSLSDFAIVTAGLAKDVDAVATVLGLFENWESSVCDAQIASGDLLAIYADGITEANRPAGEEFGEDRLLQTIRDHVAAPAPSILDAILAAILAFSGGGMRDDLTLLVARGR